MQLSVKPIGRAHADRSLSRSALSERICLSRFIDVRSSGHSDRKESLTELFPILHDLSLVLTVLNGLEQNAIVNVTDAGRHRNSDITKLSTLWKAGEPTALKLFGRVAFTETRNNE
jgi:hypothetical protein